MHIQQLAVIIAFNEELLDKFISLLAAVPFVGIKFQEPLKKYFIEQKEKLHDKSSVVSLPIPYDKYGTYYVVMSLYRSSNLSLFLYLSLPFSFPPLLGRNNYDIVAV